MTSYYYRVIAFSVKSLSGEIWYTYVMNKLTINTLDYQISKARGPWATSFTWETSLIFIYTFEKSYDYIITMIKKRKTYHLFFENWMVLIYETLSLPHPRMICAKFGWNWSSGSGDDP